MLTRSLDQIIHVANSLPAHLTVARRHYGDSPEATRALRQLQDALVEVEIALLGRAKASHRGPDPARLPVAGGDPMADL